MDKEFSKRLEPHRGQDKYISYKRDETGRVHWGDHVLTHPQHKWPDRFTAWLMGKGWSFVPIDHIEALEEFYDVVHSPTYDHHND